MRISKGKKSKIGRKFMMRSSLQKYWSKIGRSRSVADFDYANVQIDDSDKNTTLFFTKKLLYQGKSLGNIVKNKI